MGAMDPQRVVTFILTGFSGTPSRGTVTLTTFDDRARLRRAGKALGVCWACAVGCIFIPVAHFFLVPGLFLFGILQFFQRIGTRERGTGARGACPDCGVEQAFDLPQRWKVPQQVVCRHCQRGLKLTLPDTP